ncbi:MAG TPA: hypothetical protein DIW47_13425 [Bacteroidetes bacterium]|nr:hypothetical protein [Bacteroidota bacterium]
MKLLLSIVFLQISGALYSQDFVFHYSEIPLGSNKYFSIKTPLISIEDSSVYCQFLYREHTFNIDSLREVDINQNQESGNMVVLPIKSEAIDSIRAYLTSVLGKSFYSTNPNVMSGGSQQFYFAFKGNCVSYQLTNTPDSMMMKVIPIINQLLPDSFKIYIPFESGFSDLEPIIEPCPGPIDSSDWDIYGRDYDILRRNKD